MKCAIGGAKEELANIANEKKFKGNRRIWERRNQAATKSGAACRY